MQTARLLLARYRAGDCSHSAPWRERREPPAPENSCVFRQTTKQGCADLPLDDYRSSARVRKHNKNEITQSIGERLPLSRSHCLRLPHHSCPISSPWARLVCGFTPVWCFITMRSVGDGVQDDGRSFTHARVGYRRTSGFVLELPLSAAGRGSCDLPHEGAEDSPYRPRPRHWAPINGFWLLPPFL